jgi:rhomboid protease GluP
MAFGFPPKHSESFQIENLDQEHILLFAIESAKRLKWDVSFVNENGFMAYTSFSMLSWSEEISISVVENTLVMDSACTSIQLFDWGKNKKNLKLFLSTFEDVKSTMSQEDVNAKFIELWQKEKPSKENTLHQPLSKSKKQFSSFFSIFKPTKDYFVTPILILSCIFLFVIMTLSGLSFFLPDGESLLNWGANYKPMTLDGQCWRLFTSMFLHIGIFHLLMNMYALIYIGVLLEPYLGKSRFIAAYLLTGILSSLSSLYWNDLTISAGASGAIFGLYGVFLALLTTKLLDKSVKKALLSSILVFVAYNLINGLKANSGVDNAAHIGGLLSGCLIGYAFVPSLKNLESKSLKLSSIAILTTSTLVLSAIIYNNSSNDIGIYEKEIQQFISLEAKALEVFNLPDDTSEEEYINEFTNHGIYYWNENIKLLDSFKKLDLPAKIRTRNSILIEYCKLRIKSYEFVCKSIEEDTDGYDIELEDCNRKMEKLISDLTNLQ